MHPVWENLSNPWSPQAWGARLGWADPLTLAIKDGLPFTERFGPEFILFAPVVWLSVALVFWWYGRITAGPGTLARQPAGEDIDRRGSSCLGEAGTRDDRQGWIILAALLIVGGVVGPDSLGAAHGEFLPQRVVLLGLVALVPVFDVDPARWPGSSRPRRWWPPSFSSRQSSGITRFTPTAPRDRSFAPATWSAGIRGSSRCW